LIKIEIIRLNKDKGYLVIKNHQSQA